MTGSGADESDDPSVLARTIERDIRDIREALRRPLEAEFSAGQLTGPQRSVMQEVFRAGALSLKEVCARVGLSHSTVSGIVDRLVARGMVIRAIDASDRRLSSISVTDAVRHFMQHRAPVIVSDPLVRMLERASASERRAIARGLGVLRRLVAPRK